VQDNVLVLSVLGRRAVRRGPCGARSAGAGQRTSLAHQAEVVNSRIGDFSFVGFRARIANAVISDGAFVLHGATIRNVRIPRNRLVGVGQVVATQAQADALPRKEEAQAEFQREVLEVNREFAEEYIHRYERDGDRSVIGVSASPRTPFNRGLPPTIGERFAREPFARVTGDVRLGDDVTVGRRTSIRADEGAPITIGDDAAIEDRVTFHALRGTSIAIKSGLDTDDNVVFHGPLVVGDDLTIADDAVLFRSTVGDGVTIGEGALVVGPADDPLDLPDGLNVPADAVITSQDQVDALR
jgi:carbonic anhydrase/acetyltransferase-like protein (isoleucine patch superfamily)